MVRLGTCPCRSPRFFTSSASSLAAVIAVTATGTSRRLSSRRRAVTVTVSSVAVALLSSVGLAGSAAVCAWACRARAEARARVRRLTRWWVRVVFMVSPFLFGSPTLQEPCFRKTHAQPSQAGANHEQSARKDGENRTKDRHHGKFLRHRLKQRRSRIDGLHEKESTPEIQATPHQRPP